MIEEKIAEVIEVLGDGRFGLKCDDGIKRIGLCRGVKRRHLNIKTNDKVEIQILDYEPNKCNILSKR